MCRYRRARNLVFVRFRGAYGEMLVQCNSLPGVKAAQFWSSYVQGTLASSARRAKWFGQADDRRKVSSAVASRAVANSMLKEVATDEQRTKALAVFIQLASLSSSVSFSPDLRQISASSRWKARPDPRRAYEGALMHEIEIDFEPA